jgi:pimeloyl-ACP methyl ester carboxylesterase
MARWADIARTPGRGNPFAYVVAILSCIIDLPYGLFIKVLAPCSRLPKNIDTPKRRRRGLAIVLGGIEGPSFYNAQMVRGLIAGRYRGAVRRVDWNDGIPFIRSAINLMSRTHHERHARIVADMIAAHQAEHPCAPVSLIAQSGGCYIALRAAELLPESSRISTIVLHAASISPGYDVNDAAKRITHAIISVEAPGDLVLLGFGTLLFGTSDRRWCASAGLVSWRTKHTKLISMRWRPSWLRQFHFGNHTSSASKTLIRDFIAPMLLTRRGGAVMNDC